MIDRAAILAKYEAMIPKVPCKNCRLTEAEKSELKRLKESIIARGGRTIDRTTEARRPV